MERTQLVDLAQGVLSKIDSISDKLKAALLSPKGEPTKLLLKVCDETLARVERVNSYTGRDESEVDYGEELRVDIIKAPGRLIYGRYAKFMKGLGVRPLSPSYFTSDVSSSFLDIEKRDLQIGTEMSAAGPISSINRSCQLYFKNRSGSYSSRFIYTLDDAKEFLKEGEEIIPKELLEIISSNYVAFSNLLYSLSKDIAEFKQDFRIHADCDFSPKSMEELKFKRRDFPEFFTAFCDWIGLVEQANGSLRFKDQEAIQEARTKIIAAFNYASVKNKIAHFS